MCKIPLPAVFNDYPTRSSIKKMDGIVMVGIALKIARNIHIRCRLGEAQNWKCCWCGIECRAEPNHKDSATIEHVEPRSLGGADHWDNYAMACAQCNHKRGTLSVEDMLAGNFPKPRPNKIVRRNAKTVRKYIKKALHRNKHGWVREDGEPLCKQEWFDSLRIAHESYRKELEEIVFGEAA